MVDKGDHQGDPRGLIYESYRIDGITIEECRNIFLDWALGADDDKIALYLAEFMDIYGAKAPDHPMTSVLRDGLQRAEPPKRRGGSRQRHKAGNAGEP